MSTRTITTYELTHGEDTFPVTFEPVDGSEVVKVEGNTATVGYLVHDPEARGYYFDEYEQGEFLNFDSRTVKSRDFPDEDELKRLIRTNKGRVFWINKYDHSLVRYYRSGDALVVPNRHSGKAKAPSTSPADGRMIIPDQEWDVSRGVALYIAPSDCPEPDKYCDSVMNEFTDWCNGNIFGVVVQKYTRADEDSGWEPDGHEDSCWGHIGDEWAEEALKEELGLPAGSGA